MGQVFYQNPQSVTEGIANKKFWDSLPVAFQAEGYTPDAELQALINKRSADWGSQVAQKIKVDPSQPATLVKDADGNIEVVITNPDGTLNIATDEVIDGSAIPWNPAPAPEPTPAPAPAPAPADTTGGGNQPAPAVP